ncbi:MAG: orotidine-5'-phosphate decarboxylase [Candidatus Eisenbacteria bacterium]|uniref:Orotidine 5'-phosphate decarboxylase n=1 Tax=Eiseniibacteriota bacterium TaxID=2212470 RepID=A0A538T5X5_UNCEI|nr:MAG: orotidine-5'-phosphate decarboxylase [Candidatus Eisenbacteria bacterium]
MSGALRDRLIVALDRPDLKSALLHVDRIGDAAAWYKVGLELFYAAGRPAVSALAERGKRIFLDLKLHDIPATVEKAIRALEGLPVSLLTVHAAGGPEMLRAAADAARSLSSRPRVLGVTMLTSLTGSELPALWNPTTNLEEKVLGLARSCREAGVEGVVASPLEIEALRHEHAPPFLIVTPGIRGPGDPVQDQKRTLSLKEALARGADYLVVGRPILEARDPRAVVAAYEASIASNLSIERTGS